MSYYNNNYNNNNNNNNPLKDDPILRAHLGRLVVGVENTRAFRGWRQSFLQRYEELVDPAGVDIAHAAYQSFGKSLTRLMEIILKLKAFLGDNNNNNNSNNNADVWSSVRAIRYLSEWTKQLTLSGTLLENLVPNTMQREQQHGYTKFQMGVVLLRDRFAQFRRLVLCIDSLTSMEEPLREVADRQTIKSMEEFRKQYHSFCGILADVGLYPVLQKSQELAQLEGSESEAEEDDHQAPVATKKSTATAAPEDEEIKIEVSSSNTAIKKGRPDAFTFWENCVQERLAARDRRPLARRKQQPAGSSMFITVPSTAPQKLNNAAMNDGLDPFPMSSPIGRKNYNSSYGSSYGNNKMWWKSCAVSLSNTTEETMSLSDWSLDSWDTLPSSAAAHNNNNISFSSLSSLRVPRSVGYEDNDASTSKPPPRVVLHQTLMASPTNEMVSEKKKKNFRHEWPPRRMGSTSNTFSRFNSKDTIAELDDDDIDIEDDDMEGFTCPISSTSSSIASSTWSRPSAAGAATQPSLDPIKKELLYQWYTRLGQPNRESLKRKLAALMVTDVTAADIDLLPWRGGGFMLDVSEMMTEIYSSVNAP